jgi:ATP-dependent Clp protease ATP-binding subunit ClpA
MEQIVDKFIIELNDQMAGKKIYINISDAVRNWLAREGYDPNYGARPLARVIQKKIKDRLADEILFGKLVKGGVVFVDRNDEGLTFKME